MPLYTLTYDEGVSGWPSFYTFYPDWMIGMNNYFYTYYQGDLWRHNVGPLRNTYYNTFSPSIMKSVFNELPLQNKIFKTLALESNDPWELEEAFTDQQAGDFIDATWYEQKEGDWFAFLRSPNLVPLAAADFPLRSVNGIGNSTTIDNAIPVATIINFSITPLVEISSIVSIGDDLYYNTNPRIYAGEIIDVVRDYPNGDNYIVVDTTVPAATTPVLNVNYFFTAKNQTAESHGILGHYNVFVLRNFNVEATELFAVRSEVMKSFP